MDEVRRAPGAAPTLQQARAVQPAGPARLLPAPAKTLDYRVKGHRCCGQGSSPRRSAPRAEQVEKATSPPDPYRPRPDDPGRRPANTLEERSGPGTLTTEDVGESVEEDLWTDDGDADYTGWHCVRTDPFPCPAPGCTFVADFMTAAHLVLVWQERDDPNLLWHAQRAKEVGRNPRIVGYEPSFGPSASYYAWEAAGRPVHGIKGKS
ncbi:MAG: hypothetical protein ACKVUT_07930 [Gaiella sp.]